METTRNTTVQLQISAVIAQDTDRHSLSLGDLFLLHLALQLLVGFTPLLLLMMFFLGAQLALHFRSEPLLARRPLVVIVVPKCGWASHVAIAS